jgi:hypothetical protein
MSVSNSSASILHALHWEAIYHYYALIYAASDIILLQKYHLDAIQNINFVYQATCQDPIIIIIIICYIRSLCFVIVPIYHSR